MIRSSRENKIEKVIMKKFNFFFFFLSFGDHESYDRLITKKFMVSLKLILRVEIK